MPLTSLKNMTDILNLFSIEMILVIVTLRRTAIKISADGQQVVLTFIYWLFNKEEKATALNATVKW